MSHDRDEPEDGKDYASAIGLVVTILASIIGTLAIPFLLFLFLKYF